MYYLLIQDVGKPVQACKVMPCCTFRVVALRRAGYRARAKRCVSYRRRFEANLNRVVRAFVPEFDVPGCATQITAQWYYRIESGSRTMKHSGDVVCADWVLRIGFLRRDWNAVLYFHTKPVGSNTNCSGPCRHIETSTIARLATRSRSTKSA